MRKSVKIFLKFKTFIYIYFKYLARVVDLYVVLCQKQIDFIDFSNQFFKHKSKFYNCNFQPVFVLVML